MSFVIRPLLAVAALALATPAFAQVGTPATPTTTTQTATKTDVKAPDTTVKTDAKTATGATEKKDKSSKVETKGKVSANTHHHDKVTKKA
jgi:hypothetical protein